MRRLPVPPAAGGEHDRVSVAEVAIGLSPTDLANYLACPHLTTLDLEVVAGIRRAPSAASSSVEAIREQGLQHEAAYVEHLRSIGHEIIDLREERVDEAGSARTVDAMRAGAAIIVQAPLVSDKWGGRADILKRVERPSALRPWSYEPADTKLSAETKAGTILQLCTYADILEQLQGLAPERFHVVTPGTPFIEQSYRLDDFRAYHRLVQSSDHAGSRKADITSRMQSRCAASSPRAVKRVAFPAGAGAATGSTTRRHWGPIQ